MQWIRNISLVRRVTYGFGATALMAGAQGAGAMWALSGRGEDPAASTVPLALASANIALALLALWLTRSSIKDSVESTARSLRGQSQQLGEALGSFRAVGF